MRIFYPAVLALSIAIAGCGGGGDGPVPTQKSVSVAFALVSTAQPRISTVDISLTLPQGVSVPLKQGTTNEIDMPAVAGSNVTVLGTYSSPSKVHIIGTNGTGIPYARFALLTCSIAAGTPTLSSSSFLYTVTGSLIPDATLADVTNRTQLTTTFGF